MTRTIIGLLTVRIANKFRDRMYVVSIYIVIVIFIECIQTSNRDPYESVTKLPDFNFSADYELNTFHQTNLKCIAC